MALGNYSHSIVFDGFDSIAGQIAGKHLSENTMRFSAGPQESPIDLVLHRINGSTSVDAINRHFTRIPKLMNTLLKCGANARNATSEITNVADAVVSRIIQLAVKTSGPPPARFTFLALGSGGRCEQTLKTDQDNAIIYEDVGTTDVDVHRYFLNLGEIVCDHLNQLGYVFCKGGIMAKNPQWCQPLSIWKQYFSHWIHTADPEDLLQASIFFDFRGVYGDVGLAEELQRHLFASLGGWQGFFRHLTENALHYGPPVKSLYGLRLISKRTSHRHFNIKQAIMPIVDLVRVYALMHRIQATNTWERIRQLRMMQVISRAEANELEKAFTLLMQLRLAQHVEAMVTEKSEPENTINPKKLTKIEQAMLRECIRQVRRFQNKMRFDIIGS